MKTRFRTIRTIRSAMVLFCLPVLTAAMVAEATQVGLNVALAHPLLQAGKKETTFLKVGLTGFERKNETERSPVNVAIVLDKSGSMSGDKIKRAKDAAKQAVNRLNHEDIISIVTYDTTISVLVPATKISNKNEIFQAIDRIEAGGKTALFAGVSKAADELRKFLDKERVNRIILLSDGLAHVGPSSPGELGELGKSLIKERISVSTIGLGLDYNEDLMVKLAQRSDGNHYFVDQAEELAGIFNEEFGDVLSVVAQEVTVKIKCKPGIRPIRMLGREADIAGQLVVTSLNQIYSQQEKYILLEIEVPATEKDQSREVATVVVAYDNMATRTRDRLKSSVSARFTDREEDVATHVNRDVMIGCVAQIAVDNNAKATVLRDEGQIDAARRLLIQNCDFLSSNAASLNSELLRAYGYSNQSDAQNLSSDNWKFQRKKMLFEQNALKQQQKAPVKR